eukprot:m.980918 g.980918  ORF g.980918 m.980918 type:complete len:987 (-) comp23970_c0_seq7:1573-4533(-)
MSESPVPVAPTHGGNASKACKTPDENTAGEIERQELPEDANSDSTDAAAADLAFKLILFTGRYHRLPVENGWHEGTISIAQNISEVSDDNSGAQVLASELRWENDAGASWNLIPDFDRDVLITSSENPYYETQNEFVVTTRKDNGEVASFRFGRDEFTAQTPTPPDLSVVVGNYQRLPIDNDYHVGSITYTHRDEATEGAPLRWTNKAGVSWDLHPDLSNGILKAGQGNPYAGKYHAFHLRKVNGKIVGFMFGSDFFACEGYEAVPQLSAGGLKGYISMRVPRNDLGEAGYEHGFEYGVSFYVGVWSLIDEPIASFQIGLPSTWVIPDNADFCEPLVDASCMAHAWKDRAPNFYRNVFQTMEGGLGYWCSTQFGSTAPKYRINGTSNGYNHEISSPAFGFGSVKPLVGDEIGLAYLSNRLLVPPDGFTFAPSGDQNDVRGLLGNAWMALPLTTPKTSADGVATGDHCWTLFLRSSNFRGPVVFWIPEVWSTLSKTYKTINGRGLDSRPGNMGSGAMEINTVPYLEALDTDSGATFTRIPKLNFPVDENGITVLMRDVTMYSRSVLYDTMKAALSHAGDVTSAVAVPGANVLPGGYFGAAAMSAWAEGAERHAWVPPITSNPWSLRQGRGGRGEGPFIKGLDKVVKPVVLCENDNKSYVFALDWGTLSDADADAHSAMVDDTCVAVNEKIDKNNRAIRVFPQYFKNADGLVMPTATVPKSTALTDQSFLEQQPGTAYDVSKIDAASCTWRCEPTCICGALTAPPSAGDAVDTAAVDVPGEMPGDTALASAATETSTSHLGPFSVLLTDGSELEYTWCRFIDQPALQHLDWPAEERQRLQGVVEAMHREWTMDQEFMPAPHGGAPLVDLDPAQIVTPPEGCAHGFVPVVTRQGTPLHRYPSQPDSRQDPGTAAALTDDGATTATPSVSTTNQPSSTVPATSTTPSTERTATVEPAAPFDPSELLDGGLLFRSSSYQDALEQARAVLSP